MVTLTFPTIDISTLSSFELERYVAAIFQAHGYFVKRDLWWPETLVGHSTRTIDIFQADVLSYSFSPFAENSILTECKGGGTFNDFFKFAGIVSHIKPNSAFFICSNSPNFLEIEKIGTRQGIIVTRPNDIINTFTSPGSEQSILDWYKCNEVSDFLLRKENLYIALGVPRFTAEQNLAYSEIRKYNTLVSSKIWAEPDPRSQANLISTHFADNKGFIGSVRKIQGHPTCDSENAIARYVLCESAANVVLKARIEYLITALRCAIGALLSTNPDYLDVIADKTFKDIVQRMIDSINIACRLPSFLQFWIYQFGGLLNTNNNEISILGKMVNERDENIREFIDLMIDIFSISIGTGKISWGISNKAGILEFKDTPDSLRGFGMFFRREHGIDITPFVYRDQWLKRLKLITGY